MDVCLCALCGVWRGEIFVTGNSEVKRDSWDKCCWAQDLEVRGDETQRWDPNRKLEKPCDWRDGETKLFVSVCASFSEGEKEEGNKKSD